MNKKIVLLTTSLLFVLSACSNRPADTSATIPVETTVQTTETSSEAVDEVTTKANTEEIVTETEPQNETSAQTESETVPETTYVQPGKNIPTPEKKEGMGNVTYLNDAVQIDPGKTYEVLMIARDERTAYAEYYDGYRSKSGMSLNELSGLEEYSQSQSAAHTQLFLQVTDRIAEDEEEWLASIGFGDAKRLTNFVYSFTAEGSALDKISSGRCNYRLVVKEAGQPVGDISGYYGEYRLNGQLYRSPGSPSFILEMTCVSISITAEEVVITTSDGETIRSAYTPVWAMDQEEVLGFKKFDYAMMDEELQDRVAGDAIALVVDEGYFTDVTWYLSDNYRIILEDGYIIVDNGYKELYEYVKQ